MAIQVYSFSALLDIDCDNTTANLTILKNTFPSTSTPYIIPDQTQPYIDFEGYIADPVNCVFNTNFGFTLVDTSGTFSGYNETGIIVPRVLIAGADTIVDFTGFRPKLSANNFPFKTYAPYYFNFKEYKNI